MPVSVVMVSNEGDSIEYSLTELLKGNAQHNSQQIKEMICN